MKLDDLLEYMAVLKEEGVLEDCCVANVLDAIDAVDDVDYLIYGSNRYFVFER